MGLGLGLGLATCKSCKLFTSLIVKQLRKMSKCHEENKKADPNLSKTFKSREASCWQKEEDDEHNRHDEMQADKGDDESQVIRHTE